MVDNVEKCKLSRIKKTSHPRVNWYKVIYLANDEKLVKFFWRFFNTHKISKNRAARAVLIHYYSTTAAPDVVLDAFDYYRICKIAKYNIWDDQVDLA